MANHNIDRVFVALSPMHESSMSGMSVLDWSLNRFINDKPRIVLACFPDPVIATAAILIGIGPSSSRNSFSESTKLEYARRCSIKQFTTESVTSLATGDVKLLTRDLINRYGMKKIVMPSLWKSEISELFDEMPNLSCKIWYVNNGRLVSLRAYGPDPDLQKAYTDIERYKKIADETSRASTEVERLQRIANDETLRRQNAEAELLETRNRASQNEQNRSDMRVLLRETTLDKNRLESEVKILKEANEKHRKDMEKLQIERDNAVKNAEKSRNKDHTLSTFDIALTYAFTLQQLEQATRNFSDSLKIGEGGLGCVYKGSLQGTAVAIKKLKHDSTQGLPQFQREVAIVTRVRHPNLVTLFGACSQASALVYEFLPNGSLENYLTHTNDTPPLSWQLRTRIISEICIALMFLHSNKSDLVIYGVLKPDNILLDANFVSKLSDFGISSSGQMNSIPMGTIPYMDPEFFSTGGQVSAKCDIYSFGIIILRLVTGKLPANIAKVVQEGIENDIFNRMIDGFAGNWPVDHAFQLAKIGLRCADVSRDKRPNLVNEVWPVVESLTKAALSTAPWFLLSSTFGCPVYQETMKNHERMEDPPIALLGASVENQE